ncbi:MAG: UDP-N-acetylglucosamine 2-epimerase (non-hydrolyzing) [Candidatus Brocadiia bacterium]
MKRMKVMTVVGTRPEIIRLSRVIARLRETTDHTLVHTGQNYDYELNEIFFEDLGLDKPEHYLDAAGKSAAETIGQVIIRTDRILEQVSPDAVLVLGDTNSCLAAMPAKRRKIPVFHMEAGNRCFDQRVPEEINRRMVDHISDINLTYSAIAREYLLREGFPPDRVIKTGSPMLEVLTHYRPRIDVSQVLQRLEVRTGQYFLVSAHREENIESDAMFERLVKVLNGVAETYRMPIIVSTHPRTRNRIEQSNASFDDRIQFLKPMGFTDYVKLQIESRAVLSDSGTITEEANILGLRAVNIREAHERPEGMEEAAVIMTGLNRERVLQGLELAIDRKRPGQGEAKIVSDYNVPDVSEKMVRIIHSYTDYIHRVVWQKS